ncbi:MAG: cobalt-precorrin 5A hydrolase [Lachnospiraceae bacterium]|nr:cobalt-precorrin 5A hydrolase [Lachnospiraceae bacterium]
MKLAAICFTNNGIKVLKKLGAMYLFKDDKLALYSKCSFAEDSEGIIPVSESLNEWTEKNFKGNDALIFVGATGIAVRAIAPFMRDKLTDIPVIVIDENASFVIPVLSGHVGGANELSEKIAEELNAQAVITTATDINDKFAVDVFAKKNSLFIVNKDGIKEVSSKVLAGQEILLSAPNGKVDEEKLPEGIKLTDYPPSKADILITSNKDLDNANIILRPREYILGIGCKKDKDFEEILSFLSECLKEAGIDFNDLYAIASIDLKKDEEALNKLSGYLKIPFKTYSADELNAVRGVFSSSDFVKETTGVDNVCERAALLCAGENGKLVLRKKAGGGVTFAFAKRDWVIDFYE